MERGQMTTAYFDIEGNDLLDGVTRLWCGVVIDHDGNIMTFHENDMKDMVECLNTYDVVVGHNVLDYDIRALRKITGMRVTSTVHDTLIGSRLRYPDMRMNDQDKYPWLEAEYVGRHSLASWGARLRFPKGDFHDFTSGYSEEMREYCEQDVRVTQRLYQHLDLLDSWLPAFRLELAFAKFCLRLSGVKFKFDVEEAQRLKAVLERNLRLAETELKQFFPDRVTEMKKPEYWVMKTGDGSTIKEKTKTALDRRRKKLGLKPKEVTISPGPNAKQIHSFNPGSRQQVAERLHEKYGYEAPTTDKGNPSIDESVLSSLDYPECRVLSRYFLTKKRLGQLSDGAAAWLKLQQGGKISHTVNTIGCATGRVAHSSPNLGQVPAVRSEYGEEFRGLFQPHDGYVMVGADLSGIEARMLAHYMYPFDGGDFVNEVLNGDIHTRNQQMAHLPTRDDAKTFFYALMYGAGPAKIGEIIGGGHREGMAMINTYMNNMPAFKQLVDKVTYLAQRDGCIEALDGRMLPIRSDHKTLNSLLQGGAAIVAKAWSVIMEKLARKAGLDWHPLAFVHDEVQAMCRPEEASAASALMIEAAGMAGRFYKLNIPVDAEATVGNNWAETH